MHDDGGSVSDSGAQAIYLTTVQQNPNIEDNSQTIQSMNSLFQNCAIPQWVGKYFTRTLLVVVVWATVWSITGDDSLPGGNLFGLSFLLAAAAFGGFLISSIPKLRLPSLLGMLVVGFVLKNVKGINFAKDIHNIWSLTLRNIALVVILLRSGLGLDGNALRKAKWTISRLALLPCISEAVTVAIMGYLLLDMSFLWSFQLGFIIAAVSPAVVVPSLLELQLKGYGIDKGIPTLGIASASLENVFAISLVGVFLGLAFSQGNLILHIFRGPIELILGVGIGLVIGPLLWIFPLQDKNSAPQKNRFILLSAFGLLSLFGLKRANFSGAGALSTLTISFIAGLGWDKSEKKAIGNAMSVVWDFFMPLLFGLIGAEVNVEYMDTQLIGRGLAVLAVGMVPRLIVVYIAVSRNNLLRKEKLFLVLSWIPKATVQAAIGSITLDTAREKGLQGEYQEKHGIQILTLAVLSILITAPIGAVAMSMTGQNFLHKTSDVVEDLPMNKRQGQTELNNLVEPAACD